MSFNDQPCPAAAYAGGSYIDIICNFGEMLVRYDDGEYQGTDFHLIQRDRQLGIIVYSYGSCSYCDALEGVAGEKEKRELVDSMWRSVRWFDDLEAVRAFVNDEPLVKSSHFGHESGWSQFVTKVNKWRGY